MSNVINLQNMNPERGTPQYHLDNAEELKNRIENLKNDNCYVDHYHAYISVNVKLSGYQDDREEIINKLIMEKFGSLNNSHKYKEIKESKEALNYEASNYFEFFVQDLMRSFDDFMNGDKTISIDYYNEQVNKLQAWTSIGKNVGKLSDIFHGCHDIPDNIYERLILLQNKYKDDLEISAKLKLLGNNYCGFLGRSGGHLCIADCDVLDDMLYDLNYSVDNLEDIIDRYDLDTEEVRDAKNELHDTIIENELYIDAIEWLINHVKEVHKQIDTDKYYNESLENHLGCVLDSGYYMIR